jgi:hypothetical protein
VFVRLILKFVLRFSVEVRESADQAPLAVGSAFDFRNLPRHLPSSPSLLPEKPEMREKFSPALRLIPTRTTIMNFTSRFLILAFATIVPACSRDAAPQPSEAWGISSEQADTVNVAVDPEDGSATLSWPTGILLHSLRVARPTVDITEEWVKANPGTDPTETLWEIRCRREVNCIRSGIRYGAPSPNEDLENHVLGTWEVIVPAQPIETNSREVWISMFDKDAAFSVQGKYRPTTSVVPVATRARKNKK